MLSNKIKNKGVYSSISNSNYLMPIILLVLGSILIPLHPAQAYVDPGTGSYIIQIIIGIFFGTVYATKSLWRGIFQKLKKKKKKENHPND